MLGLRIFMRAQIDNSTARPNNRRGGLPERDVTSALPAHRAKRAGQLKVIVFLVDTPVEIEKGFSLSESTTSPNLSRYTFDMFWKRKKGGLSRF
jgi:hypothetical protein